MAPSIPLRIGRYRVLGLLGTGGSGGVVCRAHDPLVRRDVAVKLAPAPDPGAGPGTGNDPETLIWLEQRFFDEARIAGRLNHPGIVSVYDAGLLDERPYLVMELVRGQTLASFLPEAAPNWRGPRPARLTPMEVVDIALGCARALAHAHAMDVVHRDIKPANILIADAESGLEASPAVAGSKPIPTAGTLAALPGLVSRARLTDFSIAQHAGRVPPPLPGGKGTENARVTLGSPLYMAPEHARGQLLDGRADLYSLGAVMYHCFTGRPPLHDPDLLQLLHKVRDTAPLPLGRLRPDLPGPLVALVMACLEKDPARRPPDARTMAARLSALVVETDAPRDAGRRQDEGLDSARGLSFFQSVGEDDTARLLAIGEVLDIASGEAIVRENDTDTALYVLLRGVARVHREAHDLYTLTPGDCFGEMAFLLSRPRAATITADGPGVMALRVPQGSLERLTAESQARFYRAFSETLVQRLAQANRRMADGVEGRPGMTGTLI